MQNTGEGLLKVFPGILLFYFKLLYFKIIAVVLSSWAIVLIFSHLAAIRAFAEIVPKFHNHIQWILESLFLNLIVIISTLPGIC